mmetsp:Transcript_98916/g.221308  ORF Transcript_98916/g.221308 Transcript_98916/m.221308 type:complete len:94 (-) Transcript_98916:45-326(-)
MSRTAGPSVERSMAGVADAMQFRDVPLATDPPERPGQAKGGAARGSAIVLLALRRKGRYRSGGDSIKQRLMTDGQRRKRPECIGNVLRICGRA